MVPHEEAEGRRAVHPAVGVATQGQHARVSSSFHQVKVEKAHPGSNITNTGVVNLTISRTPGNV